MTPATLKSYSHKDLAQMAKQGGVRGWHSMRKDQLVKALLSSSKPKAATNGKKPTVAAPARRSSAAKTVPRTAARKPGSPRVQRHLSQIRAKLERSKSLASENGKSKKGIKERIVVMVRDPYWLHAYWEIRRQSVERVQAAMSQDWHNARPYLRLLEVSDAGSSNGSERVVRDIEVHGGVSNWYVHVDNSPGNYRLELGYMGSSGRFYSLVRSNIVNTPEPGSSDAIDENWTDVAENFDKIYAMSGGYSTDNNSLELQELFEERLRRPMGSPMVTRFGSGMEGLFTSAQDFKFEVDAEMIIYGVTSPNSHVSLRGEPVRLRSDGTFTVRMSLPNQRQVIPVVASAANGGEQRTIVLAVERNTKVMEPVLREAND
ncbi:MAG TPA: DUF4912 domain-containing protein [Pirellulales bacterium]|jgi:hypothetical protein|nr:DUF4912 domain-containing protein [Pirellulales bacterium]